MVGPPGKSHWGIPPHTPPSPKKNLIPPQNKPISLNNDNFKNQIHPTISSQPTKPQTTKPPPNQTT